MLLQDISKISRENIIVPRNVNAVLLLIKNSLYIFSNERIETSEIKMSLGVKRKEGKRKSYVIIFELDTVTRGLKSVSRLFI